MVFSSRFMRDVSTVGGAVAGGAGMRKLVELMNDNKLYCCGKQRGAC